MRRRGAGRGDDGARRGRLEEVRRDETTTTTTTTTREGKNARREGKNARRARAMTDARRSGARALARSVKGFRRGGSRARALERTPRRRAMNACARARALSRSLARVFDETNLNAFFPSRVFRLARSRARRTRPFTSTRPTDRPFDSTAAMGSRRRPIATRAIGRGRRRRRWTRSRFFASGVRARASRPNAIARTSAGRDGDARMHDGGCWRRAR